MSAPPETLRAGRYAISGKLGEGAQGTTYEAVDKREGRLVAIKRFDVRGAKSWKDVELAEREAKVLASLSHPLLPKYLEHFEQDGVLYLVMEKIEGDNLRTLTKSGAMREADVIALLTDGAAVLDYLHGRAPPVIHRDLKPSNVILRPDGRYCIVDFGAVRDRLRPEGGSTVVGTFGYMAPEQLQGRAMATTDVYALGVTALSMLTGCEPEDLPHRGLAIDVEAALGRRADRALVDVLREMVEPDPDRRAARLGPLVERLAARGQGDERAPRASARGRESRRGSRKERREAREREKDEREERRRRWREERRRRPRGQGAPWPLSFAVPLALLAVQLALTIVLRFAVPLLLTILSIFFGPSLRRAATKVNEAGGRAVDALERARQLVRGEAQPSGVRVAEGEPPRLRVEADEQDATDDALEDAEAEQAAEGEASERATRRRTPRS